MNETLKQMLYRIATSGPVLRVVRPMGLYPTPGSHSRQLLNVLLHKRINCILDVGAHYGEFGSLLRKVGYDGHIFSFEPVSNSFKRLSSCAADDGKWMTFNFALGAADESAEINLYQSDFFSSMLGPSGEAVRFKSHMESRGTETISIRRLDSIFTEITGIVPSPRIFLKMDTQGYDIQVFRGARDALSFIHGLQTELAGIPHYAGQPLMSEAIGEYSAAGFRPVAFFPVNHESDGINVVEWDCILAREDSHANTDRN